MVYHQSDDFGRFSMNRDLETNTSNFVERQDLLGNTPSILPPECDRPGRSNSRTATCLNFPTAALVERCRARDGHTPVARCPGGDSRYGYRSATVPVAATRVRRRA